MGQHSNSRQSDNLLETQERRAFVLELRKSGATYRQIAEAAIKQFGIETLPNGWDERYAYKDVLRELKKLQAIVKEDTEEVRELELQRLDALLLGVWKQARSGNQGAIDRVLRIMKRRAELLGIDAPQRTELTGADGGEMLVKLVSGLGDDDV